MSSWVRVSIDKLKFFLILVFPFLFWQPRSLSTEPSLSEEHEALTLCPVIFSEFDVVLGDADLSKVVLSAGTLESIQLLHPRSKGLFVMRVASPSPIPVYGAYRVASNSRKSKEYPLSLGLRGVSWDTVSQNTEELQAEVPAGEYRITIRYFSPSAGNRKSGSRVFLCEAISPSFRVDEGLALFSFS